MAPAQITVGCPVLHSQELSSIGSVGDSYDNAMAEWQWTAMGFVDGSENLDHGLGCCLGFPPFLMDFVRGAVPDRGMKPGMITVSVQSMMSPL